MSILEEKAKIYGLSLEELSMKENEIQKILVQHIPARSQELYTHIIYRILDEVYKEKQEAKKSE